MDSYKTETTAAKLSRFLTNPYFQAVVLCVILLLCFLIIAYSKKQKQYFGSGRGAPDFWEIDPELARHWSGQSRGFSADNKGKARATFAPSEQFKSESTAYRDHFKSLDVKKREDSDFTNQLWSTRRQQSNPDNAIDINLTGMSDTGTDQI